MKKLLFILLLFVFCDPGGVTGPSASGPPGSVPVLLEQMYVKIVPLTEGESWFINFEIYDMGLNTDKTAYAQLVYIDVDTYRYAIILTTDPTITSFYTALSDTVNLAKKLVKE